MGGPFLFPLEGGLRLFEITAQKRRDGAFFRQARAHPAGKFAGAGGVAVEINRRVRARQARSPPERKILRGVAPTGFSTVRRKPCAGSPLGVVFLIERRGRMFCGQRRGQASSIGRTGSARRTSTCPSGPGTTGMAVSTGLSGSMPARVRGLFRGHCPRLKSRADRAVGIVVREQGRALAPHGRDVLGVDRERGARPLALVKFFHELRPDGSPCTSQGSTGICASVANSL